MEMVTEVLARLPLKSLLRFRCVCKSWKSLISSPDFAHLHLARYHHDSDDNTSIFTLSRGNDRWMLRCSHTFSKITTISGRNQPDNDFKWPENYYASGYSVNGLLLLSKPRWSEDPKLVRTEIMLCNPVIGKVHKLPTIEFCGTTLGLGFDPSNNDYKVVAIARIPSISVHVYTFSTGTWRNINNYSEGIEYGRYSPSILIEGTIVWVINYYQKGSRMMSFDVKCEVFDYIALPPDDSTCWRYPVVHRKGVGLLDLDLLGNHSSSLWVMEKGHTPGNWSKLYTVDLQGACVPDMICFKKNGQLIFATSKEGVRRYDFETQHMKHLMKSHSFYSGHSFVLKYCTLYKESLVLL